MSRLRPGAMPMAGAESEPAPDPYEAGARARENASVYAAWVNAGRTREDIEAEQRQRHAERPKRRERSR